MSNEDREFESYRRGSPQETSATLSHANSDTKATRVPSDEEIEREAQLEALELGSGPPLENFVPIVGVPVPNVRQIRENLGLSQREFAEKFDLSPRTVQQWEQGRSTPDHPARILLSVIAQNHKAVVETVDAIRDSYRWNPVDLRVDIVAAPDDGRWLGNIPWRSQATLVVKFDSNKGRFVA